MWLLLEPLLGFLSAAGGWLIRYLAPSMITMLVMRASSHYIVMGLSLAFYLSSFLAVMTFVNGQATDLLNQIALGDNPYWLTGLSMLPSNILSCLTVVFLSYTVYLTFRFKIYIANMISQEFTQGALPPGQARLPGGQKRLPKL
ncbi:TPA: hypothetical protein G9F26_003956 [Salmonella enterica]|uniref:Uncharacterized protein n=1 Tax=Salmonella enterica TaxID=28901 RepID=A0A750MRK2_SALER|nr:hypothetical protein [Salmonella enterica]